MTHKTSPYWIPGIALIAFATLAFCAFQSTAMAAMRPAGMEGLEFHNSLDDAISQIVILLMSLVAIPMSYWLPVFKPDPLTARLHHFPSSTLLLDRWLICLIGTDLIGISIGLVISTLVVDVRLAALAVGMTASAIAFNYSATKRFWRHPKAEFVGSFLNRRSLRRMMWP